MTKVTTPQGQMINFLQGLKELSAQADRVSISMFVVLWAIALEEEKNMSHYAEATGFTLANVHRHISNLSAIDLVTIAEPSYASHGRTRIVHTTEKGRALISKVMTLASPGN